VINIQNYNTSQHTSMLRSIQGGYVEKKPKEESEKKVLASSIELTTKLVCDLDDFSSLKTQWNELYTICERSTIFSSWEWLFTWWEVFKDQYQRQLYILCFYHNNQLVGIAPFQIDKRYPQALVQGKTLRFIGSGDSVNDRIVTEYIDFIVFPGFEQKVVLAVSDYLIAHRKDWDFADFEYLLEDSLILQCFTSKSRISCQKIECGGKFSVSGIDDFDSYINKMGNRWRKMLVKKERHLLRDGEVEIKTTDSIESIKPAFDQLSKMHCSRWRDRVNYCIFDSSRFREFHTKIITRLLPLNKSFIKTITLNGEALATYYAFTDKGQVHYYQSGFYSKYANKYSPLFLLICKDIKLSINNKEIFDFMHADSKDSYKGVQYAAEYEPMYRLRWASHPFRLFVFRCVKAIQENISVLYCRIVGTIKKIGEKFAIKYK